ncbi:15944_t:CDS:2, partial [Funneliformis mosseae]
TAGSNSETTFRGNDSNKVRTDITPTFPPDLTINDLIKNVIKPNALKSVKIKSPPNSFIARCGYIYAQTLSSRLLTIEDSGAMCPHFDNGSTSISQVGTYLNHNFLEDPNDQVYKKLL